MPTEEELAAQRRARRQPGDALPPGVRDPADPGNGTMPGSAGSRTKQYGVALFGWEAGGPLHPGHTSDQHLLGPTNDNENVNVGHIWTDGLFYRDLLRDGPLHFEEPFWTRPASFPLRSHVHLQFDPSEPHSWPGGEGMGKWKWWAEVPEMVTMPPERRPGLREPEDPDPNPPPGIPPTITPPRGPAPPPGSPGFPGPTTPGGGGGTAPTTGGGGNPGGNQTTPTGGGPGSPGGGGAPTITPSEPAGDVSPSSGSPTWGGSRGPYPDPVLGGSYGPNPQTNAPMPDDPMNWPTPSPLGTSGEWGPNGPSGGYGKKPKPGGGGGGGNQSGGSGGGGSGGGGGTGGGSGGNPAPSGQNGNPGQGGGAQNPKIPGSYESPTDISDEEKQYLYYASIYGAPQMVGVNNNMPSWVIQNGRIFFYQDGGYYKGGRRLRERNKLSGASYSAADIQNEDGN